MMSFAAARRVALRGHRHLCACSSAAAHPLPPRGISRRPAWPIAAAPTIPPPRQRHPRPSPLLSDARCRLSTEAAALDDDGGEGDDDAPLPRFSSLPGLHPSSLHAVEAKMGLATMTEIQHKTFAAASSGRDTLGRARTGTGKTLAFLLPAIENALRLGRTPGPRDAAAGTGGIAVLVLSPTRELAMQVRRRLLFLPWTWA